MKRYSLIIVGVVIACLVIGIYYSIHPLVTSVSVTPGEQSTVSVGQIRLTVDLAVTDEERYRGLSGRESMSPDHGMLFVFPSRERHGFVMRDMNFPLDFLWIDGTKIVDITPSVPVDTTLPLKSYQPSVPVDKVLELHAGTADRLGIRVGDTLTVNH